MGQHLPPPSWCKYMRTRPWGWLRQTDEHTPTSTAKERPPHFHPPLDHPDAGEERQGQVQNDSPEAHCCEHFPAKQQAPLWDQAHLHEEARQVLSAVNTEGNDPSQTTGHSGSDRLLEPLTGHWLRTTDGALPPS